MNHTKWHILNCFDDLIHKTEFNKINVKMLCDYAQISRPTFYRYFQDLDDIAITTYHKHSDQVFKEADGKSYYEVLYDHGKFLFDPTYKSMILNYCKNKPYDFLGYVSDNLYRFSKKYYETNMSKNLDDYEDFSLILYVKGGAFIILEILLGTLDYSLEEFINHADKCKPEFLDLCFNSNN